MRLPFIDAELARQNVGLEKACVDGFIMFAAVIFPIQFFLQDAQRFLLVVRQIIEKRHAFDPSEDGVIKPAWQAQVWKAFEWTGPLAPMDAPDIAPVGDAVGPPDWQDAFGSQVGAADNVTDAFADGSLVKDCGDGVIGRDLAIGHGGFEEGQLKISELVPVQDVCVEVDTEFFKSLFDVADG